MSFNLDTVGSVYFLIRGDRVKVGFSTDVAKRLASFQHERGDLLAVINGVTMADEKACHKYLRRWWIRGEWFHAAPDFLDACQWLIDGGVTVYGAEDRSIAARERTAIARAAALTSWANTQDWTARTAPARAGLERKFLEAAGGDLRRAEAMRKAYFARLALKSAQSRRAKKEASR